MLAATVVSRGRSQVSVPSGQSLAAARPASARVLPLVEIRVNLGVLSRVILFTVMVTVPSMKGR